MTRITPKSMCIVPLIYEVRKINIFNTTKINMRNKTRRLFNQSSASSLASSRETGNLCKFANRTILCSEGRPAPG